MKRVLYLLSYPGIADMEGLEPTALRLTAECSAIELHIHNCGSRARTYNLLSQSQMLYQLSYTAIVPPVRVELTTFGLRDRCSAN